MHRNAILTSKQLDTSACVPSFLWTGQHQDWVKQRHAYVRSQYSTVFQSLLLPSLPVRPREIKETGEEVSKSQNHGYGQDGAKTCTMQRSREGSLVFLQAGICVIVYFTKYFFYRQVAVFMS